MNELRIEQFSKFYDALMSNAPDGYKPWIFPCAKQGKNPAPSAIMKIDSTSNGSWHHESARLTKEQALEHIRHGWNIGISARKDDPLVIGDIDEIEYLKQIPENTLTSTSRKRAGAHFFGWNKDNSAKVNLPTDFGEIRANNQYVLAPGSYVPFNLEDTKDKKAFDNLDESAEMDELVGYYTVRDAVSPRELVFDDFPQFFKDKQRENIEAEAIVKQRIKPREFGGEGKYSALFKLKMSDIVGALPSNERNGHPLHESDTDSNFSLSADGSICHCWRHLVSLNPVQFLAVKAGFAKCEDAGTPHEGRGMSKIKGDKAGYEAAYNEAVKMKLIKEWDNNIGDNNLPLIKVGGSGVLVSKIAEDIADVFSEHETLFYKQEVREIVEVSKIQHDDEDKSFIGFSVIKPKRFITLSEKYFTPFVYDIKKTESGKKELIKVPKSLTNDKANIILASPHFQERMATIKRIFSVPMPMMYKGELSFPRVGYDDRFYSWLNPNTPVINTAGMTINKAKNIIENIFKEFCFENEQDYINSIAGVMTPFLRGLFPEFSTRTPMFFYVANRERAGKDYLASITGLLLEDQAIDEPPISDGESNGNKNDELRKKLLSCALQGRRRLHFANNKGRMNNSVLEAALTSKTISDRMLGRNEVVTVENELDISASGNVGITFTPDLSNRCIFIKLFLDIENANDREFNNPDLHGWIKKHRGEVLSAIFFLIEDWVKNGSKSGSKRFASFPEWANICGGIMENAGFGSPCIPNDKTLTIGGDTESQEMKQLFETAYNNHPEEPIKKAVLIDIIKQDEALFPYIDWENKSDQAKFGKKLIKFYGRVFSDIRLNVINPEDRTARHKIIFTKQKKEGHYQVGKVGKVGNVFTTTPHINKNNDNNKTKSVLDGLSPYQPYQDTKIPVVNGKKVGKVYSEGQNETLKKLSICPKCSTPMLNNKCLNGDCK